VRAARWTVVVGGALPLLLGATLGSVTTTAGAGTWAAPMPAGAFLALSLGLAVSHLLVVPAYTSLAQEGSAPVRRAAVLGAAGSVLLAACEVWSGLLARTPLGSPVLVVLDGGYLVAALAVVVGTLVLAAALWRSAPRPRLSWPVLVNGVLLLVATLLKHLVSDGLGIAALTAWSLSYAWWGLRLPRTSGRRARSQAVGAGTA
jgi:hypothetical protein